MFSMHDSIKLAITSLNGDLLNCQSLRKHYIIAKRPTFVSIWLLSELLILPEHLSSPSVFSGVRVDRCLSLFFWPLCVVCPSLIYKFWLALWYLQTLLLLNVSKQFQLNLGKQLYWRVKTENRGNNWQLIYICV